MDVDCPAFVRYYINIIRTARSKKQKEMGMQVIQLELTQVIQLELIDLVTNGLTSFSDMLKDVYGDGDGMEEAAIEEIGRLTKLLTLHDSSKIVVLKEMFLEGNLAMLSPDTLDLCVGLEKQRTPYLVEVVDKGETLCFIKQDQI